MNRDQSEQYNERICLAILMALGGLFVRCISDLNAMLTMMYTVIPNNITLTGTMMHENTIK